MMESIITGSQPVCALDQAGVNPIEEGNGYFRLRIKFSSLCQYFCGSIHLPLKYITNTDAFYCVLIEPQ